MSCKALGLNSGFYTRLHRRYTRISSRYRNMPRRDNVDQTELECWSVNYIWHFGFHQIQTSLAQSVSFTWNLFLLQIMPLQMQISYSLSLSLSHSLSLSLFLCVNKLFLHYPSIATCFDKLSKEMSGIACISCVNSVLIRSPAQGEVMKGNGFFLDKIRLDDSVALPVLLLELRLVRFEHTNFPPTNEK